MDKQKLMDYVLAMKDHAGKRLAEIGNFEEIKNDIDMQEAYGYASGFYDAMACVQTFLEVNE